MHQALHLFMRSRSQRLLAATCKSVKDKNNNNKKKKNNLSVFVFFFRIFLNPIIGTGLLITEPRSGDNAETKTLTMSLCVI